MQYRSLIGGGLVLCGVLLGTLQVLQYVRFPETSTVLLLNTVPFVLVAGAIAYTGMAIVTGEAYNETAPLIISWAVGGAVGFVAVFTLVTGTSEQVGMTLLLGAVDAGSAGGLAGLVIGLYDAQNRRTLATVERFATKLEVLNNYGKVLNQSTDIESVSALCIEVVEFVLDGDGAAFVIDAADDSYTVDTTLPPVESDTPLGIVREEMRDQEGLRTVTDGSGFATLRDGQPGSTMAIRIPAGEATAVLFAIYYDLDEIDDKNVNLFEILAAHVSTALSSVDSKTLQSEYTDSF